jgi:hypothetical protein
MLVLQEQYLYQNNETKKQNYLQKIFSSKKKLIVIVRKASYLRLCMGHPACSLILQCVNLNWHAKQNQFVMMKDETMCMLYASCGSISISNYFLYL